MRSSRTDPQQAARYRLPSFNFDETYTDGTALGVTVGMTRQQAIRAVDTIGFVIEPSGWGDNRAGGTKMYTRAMQQSTMAQQNNLNFYDPRGMSISFNGNRVDAVTVFYINFEGV